MSSLTILEATIDELQAGHLTLVILHHTYDCRGISLNSIPVLNEAVFEEAAASDDRRADGLAVRSLEGIPYTVKDSYKVQGMTLACGSPAFEHLIANEDAFTVGAIRKAGGVLLGRTNMPPMAYGGMQRGIYGRAESPYNPQYLAAAFWSGSSNGSAVATAASFCTFGMAEETVSSGRSPASNNALVAYTPSRGWLSLRGNWPLYPTCDVVVPHTRSMNDMLRLLEVIAAPDATTEGDFWRDQPFVRLEKPWASGLHSLAKIGKRTSLSGVKIAIPHMYIGGNAPTGAVPVTTCTEVIELWEETKTALESLGAEIVVVPDFPVVTAYENPKLMPENCPQRPQDWHASERGPLIAHAWNLFLAQNRDAKIPNLHPVDPFNIYPESMRTAAELKVLDRSNAIRFAQLADYIAEAPLYETKNIDSAISALENMRKCLLEDWLTALGCDCVVFPAAGDVAAADADVNDASAEYAFRNGVFYSNGNKALRHLGVPTVSVPMGIMKHKRMPVNLTFAGRACDDANLLAYANALEKKTQKRLVPPHTPALKTDHLRLDNPGNAHRTSRPELTVDTCVLISDTPDATTHLTIYIEGIVGVAAELDDLDNVPDVEITVDAVSTPLEHIAIERQGQGQNGQASFRFKASICAPKSIEKNKRSKTIASVAGDKIMVIVLSRSRVGGRPSGWLKML